VSCLKIEGWLAEQKPERNGNVFSAVRKYEEVVWFLEKVAGKEWVLSEKPQLKVIFVWYRLSIL